MPSLAAPTVPGIGLATKSACKISIYKAQRWAPYRGEIIVTVQLLSQSFFPVITHVKMLVTFIRSFLLFYDIKVTVICPTWHSEPWAWHKVVYWVTLQVKTSFRCLNPFYNFSKSLVRPLLIYNFADTVENSVSIPKQKGTQVFFESFSTPLRYPFRWKEN